MSSSTRNQLTRFSCALALTCLAFLVPDLTNSKLSAQGYQTYQPKNREFIRGDMPPGVAADLTRMGNPKLNGHVQPVRVIGPIGARLEVSTENGYVQTNSSRVSVGLQIGPVYRFKVTNIPRHFGKELYPSVEVLGKLNPPKGLENEFPVQVVIGQEDLEEALSGRMVTKVVYLENPEISLPHVHQPDKQPYFDVGAAQDPLKAARELGRPMAILRIGSRIPTAKDAGREFNFYAPSPTMVPDPQGAGLRAGAGARKIPPIEIPGRIIQPTLPGRVMPLPNGNR